ncbi:conserved hypothetical protein [Candidatus Methylobacter favarea]|uniref:Uncharacterized protein n=1 Tax=Candidatus Methylobacter favarea TaxID=2707345 RepID=A0A8S0Y9H5_9GAMM|nr:nodulation protein NodZ [Candidatus Methylobacter favarea]CAA9890148.1 conserved hypothetical protein [Candidatus Methylobacter favarea]
MNVRELYRHPLFYCKGVKNHANKKIKTLYHSLRQRNNQGVYAININVAVGFSAQLNWCLYIFDHCERYNLLPYIVLSSPFYTLSQGDNWFDYYFDNLKLTEIDKKNVMNGLVKVSSISHISHIGLPSTNGRQMSLEYAHELLEKNIRIKDEIQEYVDSFVNTHFGQKTVLGIHYRGRDKQLEAKPVSWEFCAKAIHNYLDTNPQVEALFISSDEGNFIDWIEKEFKSLEVIYHDDKERGSEGNALHTQPDLGNNYTKGKEALINCLLLSRCNALIRTASLLSGWASIFNPSLPVTMLNRPYLNKLWFPDALILKKSRSEYLPSQI